MACTTRRASLCAETARPRWTTSGRTHRLVTTCSGVHRGMRAEAKRYCDASDFWLDPQDNLRAVGVVARASPEWKQRYARRQSIERMFGSMKRSRLLNRHQFMKRRKLETHINLSVLTYLATMLTRALAGDLDRMRRMRLASGSVPGFSPC